MRSKKIKKLIMLPAALLLVTALVLTGCTGDTTDSTTETETTTPTLSGTIQEGGSTSVAPLAELMAYEFMQMYPDVRIDIAYTGSSAGVRACTDGTVDIGAASRDVRMTEADLITIPIARDAVAIVAHPDNDAVADLTVEQVAKIYTGEITNWSEVGGSDAEIVAVSREEGSGTRDCFESKIMDDYGDIKANALFYDSNGGVRSKVMSEPNAIGYVGLGYVEGLHAFTIEGVAASVETAQSGEYPVLRRLNFLTLELPVGTVKAFIDFCRSEEGQAIALDEGFVPLVTD